MPQPQQRVWRELGQIPSDFVLYGGTAISLRLAHRESIDRFRFLYVAAFVPDDLLRPLPLLRDCTVQRAAANTLVCSVDREGPVIR